MWLRLHRLYYTTVKTELRLQTNTTTTMNKPNVDLIWLCGTICDLKLIHLVSLTSCACHPPRHHSQFPSKRTLNSEPIAMLIWIDQAQEFLWVCGFPRAVCSPLALVSCSEVSVQLW